MTRGLVQLRPAILVAIVLCSVIGLVLLPSGGDLQGQGPDKSGAKASKAKPGDKGDSGLSADLQDAIAVLERSDFREFLERYAPVDILRRLRQQDLVDRAAAGMARQPQTRQQLLAMLTAVQKQTPVFDKSRSVVTYQLDTSASGIEAVTGEVQVPAIDESKPGLGGDLNKVLAEASKLLAAGDAKSFVENLFPASELARLNESGGMQDLLEQLKPPNERPDARPKGPVTAPQNQDSPNLLAALQADFKLLQTLKPDLSEKGIAIFQIKSEDAPVRVIKFQKTRDDWRLFDDAPRVTTELTRQSRLKPRSSVTTIQLERIRDNWRFIELPSLRSEGK
jgi:hypothetical protein